MTEEERIRNAERNLDVIVRGSHVILDVSACMHPAFETFISNLEPLLSDKNHNLVLFNVTMQSLAGLVRSSDATLSTKAKRAWKILSDLSQNGLVAMMTIPPTQSIIEKMQSFRTRDGNTYQTFVTQDKQQAEEIFMLNEKNGGSKIEVRQINQYGYLSRFPTHKNAVFRIVSTEDMYKGPFNVVKSSRTYDDGDTISLIVDNNRKDIVLGKKLSEGGEGVIFLVRDNPAIVVKLFKDEDVSDERAFYSRKKVELLLQNHMSHSSICFPLAGAYDASGNMIGYAMQKVEGVELSKLLIGSQQTIKQHFGQDATRKETVRLCIAFLEAVKYLHDNNIVIGDLRTENIIVKSPDEIVIIDTDSFQLNEFPCPVGTPLYTPPERITDDFCGMDRSKFMRTKSDDIFAVATILFQILMPSKEPYTKQDGSGDILQDIKIGDFAYAKPGGGDTPHANAPKGNWRFCWSHIEPNIRRMMYQTFMKGEANYAPEKRIPIDKWLKAFHNYYGEIQNGGIKRFDSMSLDLIPIRFIRSNHLQYGKCKNPECRLDIVAENELKRYHGYCYRCAHTITDEYTCPVCQENDIVYRLTDELEGKPKPQKCWDCYQKELNQVIEERTCVECGDKFTITKRDQIKYEKRGHQLPKRCPKCIELKASSNNSSNRTASRPQNTSRPAGNAGARPATPPTQRQENFWDKLRKLIGI